MALHEKHSIRHNIEDEKTSIPKYKFPDQEQDPRHRHGVVHDELMLDGNSRQNLATFCQTRSEPEAHCLVNECIAKNIEDRDEIKSRPEVEGRNREHPGS
jgi:glutamate decarboxylase